MKYAITQPETPADSIIRRLKRERLMLMGTCVLLLLMLLHAAYIVGQMRPPDRISPVTITVSPAHIP